MQKAFKKFAAGVLAASLFFSGIVHAEGRKFNMSYLYAGRTDQFANTVAQTKGSLQVVSPAYFEISREGNLVINPHLDSSFIDTMHNQGVGVVPYVTNDWDQETGIRALGNRQELARQLAKAVSSYHLDGINIDLENIPEIYRNEYTEFVRTLRELLPAGKELSAAVGANPDAKTVGWLGIFDYKELANLCDYLMVMAYDENYFGDPTPGPVSSLTFAEKSIDYALSQAAPEKIVLGIPFYGRLWKMDGTIRGEGLSVNKIESMIRMFHAHVETDAVSREARVTFTIGPGDPQMKVNGATLTLGEYEIWYEHESAVKEKLALVQKYNLKGTGSWSLSMETGKTWDYYTLWMNGAYFSDTAGHWAQNAIASMVNRGWINGMPQDRFEPDSHLTRAQAAAIIMRAMRKSKPDIIETNPLPSSSSFADVAADHWAAAAIAWAQQQGIINGVSPDQFGPELILTREEAAALIARMMKWTGNRESLPFTDLARDRWSLPYISAVFAEGAVDGFADGSFRPEQPITRAQFAVIMERIADKIQ